VRADHTMKRSSKLVSGSMLTDRLNNQQQERPTMNNPECRIVRAGHTTNEPTRGHPRCGDDITGVAEGSPPP
jgi:hypothetical protein